LQHAQTTQAHATRIASSRWHQLSHANRSIVIVRRQYECHRRTERQFGGQIQVQSSAVTDRTIWKEGWDWRGRSIAAISNNWRSEGEAA
jgi:hypothetical protein